MALDEEFDLPDSEGGYVPPTYASGDWAVIADLAAGRTDYRSINFGTTSPATGTIFCLANSAKPAPYWPRSGSNTGLGRISS